MSQTVNFLNINEQHKVKVREFYNKSEEDVQKDVDVLLEWLNKQRHLPKPFDPVRVESFLLKNKFSIEKTKTKLDKYYRFKGMYPKFFEYTDVDNEAIKNNSKVMILIPLPKPLPTLERIIFFTFTERSAALYDSLNSLNYISILLEIGISYDYNIYERIICDLNNLTLKHITKMDPILFGQGTRMYLEIFSGRISFIEIINFTSSMAVFIKLLKQVLPSKTFQRLRIHKDLDSLHEVIPKEYLPVEYGGNQESIYELHEKCIDELRQHKRFLLENAKVVSNEKLRIGKLPNNDLFGTNGTFKNLNLD